MLKTVDLRGSTGPLTDLILRPSRAKEPPTEYVRQIVDDVSKRGDEAVIEYTEKFDGCSLKELRVEKVEIDDALNGLSANLRAAMDSAITRIRAFHENQRPNDFNIVVEGVEIEERNVPVTRAGLYAPGGLAAYPSTVFMTAIPAQVVGVEQIVICCPPDKNGKVNNLVLAAAALLGIDEIYAVGGAQAIAAMAYGTESIPSVDAIVGPGNIFVAVAKQIVSGMVAVPGSFAGPSEVVVIADDSVNPEFVAIDLIAQAEHGPDGMSSFVTWIPGVADQVVAFVEKLSQSSARSAEISTTLNDAGCVVLVDSPQQAIDVANAIAPEHLQLMCKNADALSNEIVNAGAIFVGEYTPASLGDYLAGPSHVLPVYGSARYASALGVYDFCKKVHVIKADKSSFTDAASSLIELADAEGLVAHADSARIRINN